MLLLSVRHATTYRYARSVKLGEHRLMLRPRDSHDLRLVGAELTLSPPGTSRWVHDVFGNSVALVNFGQPTAKLSIVSTLSLERYGRPQQDFPLDPDAETYPFVYSASDRTDLGRLLEEHYPDRQDIVGAWARRFVTSKPISTIELLARMNGAVRDEFEYVSRDAEGTQTPLETLENKAGSCRDLALLFIEAVRALGFGARFVSGYLYDPDLDSGRAASGAIHGAGATHAWADVYLPGAGWIEYDPTNASVAAENLIRIAVTRDPSQAVPVGGTFDGGPGDFLGLEVQVSVTMERRR